MLPAMREVFLRRAVLKLPHRNDPRFPALFQFPPACKSLLPIAHPVVSD